jgi:hypothetical protein
MLFAYFGPDTVLPLTSTFAAVVGFLLMFGRLFLRLLSPFMRRVGRLVGIKPRATEEPVVHHRGKSIRHDGAAGVRLRTPGSHGARSASELDAIQSQDRSV